MGGFAGCSTDGGRENGRGVIGVQVLPLGTGNDLSLSFGWGNTFLSQWLENFASVYDLLRRIAEAQPRELDCWRVTISAGALS